MPVAIPLAVAAVAGGATAAATSQANKQKKSAEEGLSNVATTLYERGKMTDQEYQQWQDSFKSGTLLEDIQKGNLGLGQYPSGYLSPEQQYQQTGPMSQALYNRAAMDVMDPYASYESTLQQQLGLAKDYINTQFNQRGFAPGGETGLAVEQMGRAGAELAIAEANARMNWRQQMLNEGAGISQTAMNLGQQNYSNLYNQYALQQGLAQTGMQRQLQAAGQTAQIQAYPYQAQLGSAYGQGAGQNAGMAGMGAFANTFSSMYGMGGLSNAFRPNLGASGFGYPTTTPGYTAGAYVPPSSYSSAFYA